MTNNKKLSDLNFDTKNANKHTAKGQKALEDSLQKYGAGRSILVDKNNNIIAGNLTAEVFGQIGLEEVQIVESDGKKLIVVKRTDIDINSKAGRELAISDNRASELSLNWDSDALKDIQENFKVDLSEFFSNKELKLLGLDNINLNEENFEFADEIKTDIVLGDLFEIGEHRLLCGDSTDSDQVAKLMNGQKADMVFTDPPYGVNYEKKAKLILGRKQDAKIEGDNIKIDFLKVIILNSFCNINKNLRDGGVYYICSPQGGQLGIMMMMMIEAGIECRHIIIWKKDSPVFSMGRLDYDYQHEPILYGWKKNHKHYGEGIYKTSVWDIARPKISKLHPTMKPIELIENAILNSSVVDNIILDLFLGSGSTMVASHQLKRKCYGMEIEPKYCQVILDRMIKLDPSLKIIKNGKHS